MLPAASTTVVAWIVTSGQDDYEYIYGSGFAIVGTHIFDVNLAAAPPAAAINAYGMAIGIIAALPPETTPPEEGILRSDLSGEIVGATSRHAIIWKAYCAPDYEWFADFSPGYSCGECVSGDQGFDSFQPVDCSHAVLHVAPFDSLDFCNWT